jgi:hypothetical protein
MHCESFSNEVSAQLSLTDILYYFWGFPLLCLCYYETFFHFRTCGQLDAKSALDFKSLMATITSSFAYFVQYNGVVKFGIKDICNYIDNLPSTKTSYEKVAETINRINYHLENECLAFSYSGFCSYVSGDGWNSDGASSGGRLWIWQVCNELASFQTTSTATLPFGANVPASFFASECKCAFGDR